MKILKSMPKLSSRTKWLVIGPTLTIVSLTIFIALLSQRMAIGLVMGPFIGAGVALWAYGWVEKCNVFGPITEWLNSDED